MLQAGTRKCPPGSLGSGTGQREFEPIRAQTHWGGLFARGAGQWAAATSSVSRLDTSCCAKAGPALQWRLSLRAFVAARRLLSIPRRRGTAAREHRGDGRAVIADCPVATLRPRGDDETNRVIEGHVEPLDRRVSVRACHGRVPWTCATSRRPRASSRGGVRRRRASSRAMRRHPPTRFMRRCPRAWSTSSRCIPLPPARAGREAARRRASAASVPASRGSRPPRDRGARRGRT